MLAMIKFCPKALIYRIPHLNKLGLLFLGSTNPMSTTSNCVVFSSVISIKKMSLKTNFLHNCSHPYESNVVKIEEENKNHNCLCLAKNQFLASPENVVKTELCQNSTETSIYNSYANTHFFHLLIRCKCGLLKICTLFYHLLICMTVSLA